MGGRKERQKHTTDSTLASPVAHNHVSIIGETKTNIENPGFFHGEETGNAIM